MPARILPGIKQDSKGRLYTLARYDRTGKNIELDVDPSSMPVLKKWSFKTAYGGGHDFEWHEGRALARPCMYGCSVCKDSPLEKGDY